MILVDFYNSKQELIKSENFNSVIQAHEAGKEWEKAKEGNYFVTIL